MLDVQELSVSYGPVRALSDVSLTVARGSVTAVIGANGAGKSSLMHALAGLVRPQRGRALLDGVEITGRSCEQIVRMGVALVPEGRGIIGELTVEENLRLGGMWRPHRDRAASLAEVTDLFPILAQRARFGADTLSGGERQQLAIARALMCNPSCLLLDEPSLGLAPLVVQQILVIVQRLATDLNLAVLLVEQNAVLALRLASTAVVLQLGRVVGHGPAEEIAASADLRHVYLGTS